MVNGTSSLGSEGRERDRPRAEHALALAANNLNPFGDLHTLQHLSARLARLLRGVFEPMMRRAIRAWAEPLTVERFSNYVAERKPGLTAWVPLTLRPGGGQAFLVLDGRFTLEMLDLFFGGLGDTPDTLPNEFSPAAEALVRRIAAALVPVLQTAWEPVTRIGFEPGNVEMNPSLLASLDSEDPVIVTRFGIAAADGEPTMVDLLYPVAALKPHAVSLNTRVHGPSAEPDPRWRNNLTRVAMGVRFPVRSVLAEPTISLGRLLELKEGDVIPVSFGPEVPVMVNNHRLGTGTIGTANGKAAIRLASIVPLLEEDLT
ncbi:MULTISPECIES: flagellar motor switch protein FliM [unclassified Sphingomonas]|jgi:flagellar motor switch protein FliM|uniref:flagellar motor switch protein FliM n=1 Tax=unclassified Sphingomonas TaxID=196159 RepID=UPI00083734B5|nr:MULTISPECIES: FliM/FliN family flagellar motor switch protein [unclassified Sphingomonas]MCH4894181.1 flagellar motor switch protein FliM [Sphingomonas sp. SFZ2018-12]